MKRILPVLLIVCLLLCACAQNGPEQTTAPVTTAAVTEAPTTEAATTAATEETTVPETTEATEPPVVIAYRNPLNGQPVEEPFTARPYTVIINNISDAQPMCGLSNADFLFEVLAEGGITRCLGVFSDISGLDHIGAIRSARPYFVELANSFDSIFVHHGGSKDGYAEIRNLGIDDIDALGRGNAAFYRDQDRLDNGYSLEHTSFADGDDILEEVADLEFTTHRVFVIRQHSRKQGPMYQGCLKLVELAQEKGELTAATPAEQMLDYLLTVQRAVVHEWCIQEGRFDLPQATAAAVACAFRAFAP